MMNANLPIYSLGSIKSIQSLVVPFKAWMLFIKSRTLRRTKKDQRKTSRSSILASLKYAGDFAATSFTQANGNALASSSARDRNMPGLLQ